MTRFVLLILLIALGIMNLVLFENNPPNAGLPLVHADLRSCAILRAAPLLRTPHGRLDYRLGKPSNDRGET